MKVYIIDTGKDTCKKLLNAGIACSFIMTHAVPYLIKEATKIIVGASAVMTNGDIMGRVGTALICMAAHDNRIPVVALCESYKFADGLVRLDSFVWNELGDPDLLVDTSNRSMAEKFYDGADKDLIRHAGALREWNSAPQLLLVNLHYDITPAKFVTMLACEHGLIPSTLVASVSSMAL